MKRSGSPERKNSGEWSAATNQLMDGEPYNPALDKHAVALFGGLKKRKSKNMKKRRKYKK